MNRAREGWDIHHLYRGAPTDEEGQGVLLSSTDLGHLVLSLRGAEHLLSLPEDATTEDISEDIRARFVKSDVPIQLPQRQSLATASRFAQLFYWMLESKHPLLLFGIPGVVLFVLGYRLSGDLASMFTELNSTSIGVSLITIAMTLIGLFAMMVALILYIMGKQVARIQNQYNWPKGVDFMSGHLVCLDMDRVLVDHLSTWQFVYDKLGISNDESFELYNQGLLDEWDWIKLDLALIKSAPGAT